jgi:hypothetical protein
LSGGFDEFGDSKAPQEIGKVTFDFTLVATSRTEMTAKRDAVLKMADWGVQRLIAQPTDPMLPARWCYARINDINIPERLDMHTDLWQPVTINWQVPEPRWYGQGTESVPWGMFIWGEAAWGSGAAPIVCSGVQTNFTITTLGTATTRARITLVTTAPSAQAQNPKVQRLVSGLVVDEVAFAGTLSGTGDTLEINARSWQVTRNGSDAYNSSLSFLHPDWMRLLPGVNQMRIVLGSSGNICTAFVRYFDMYY